MIKNSTETKSHGLNTVTISGYEAFFFFFQCVWLEVKKEGKNKNERK